MLSKLCLLGLVASSSAHDLRSNQPPKSHDGYVTISTQGVNTETTSITNNDAASSSTSTGSGADRDFFNPEMKEHSSVAASSKSMTDQEANQEDETPPCPEGADCEGGVPGKHITPAMATGGEGRMVTESTNNAAPVNSDYNLEKDGKVEITTAKAAVAKNLLHLINHLSTNKKDKEEIVFQPKPSPTDQKNPEFLHQVAARHKKRHARLTEIKNHVTAIKKEIVAIKIAHQKDKKLIDAHKKKLKSIQKQGTHLKSQTDQHSKDHQGMIKMGKEISEILKVVKQLSMTKPISANKDAQVAEQEKEDEEDEDEDEDEDTISASGAAAVAASQEEEDEEETAATKPSASGSADAEKEEEDEDEEASDENKKEQQEKQNEEDDEAEDADEDEEASASGAANEAADAEEEDSKEEEEKIKASASGAGNDDKNDEEDEDQEENEEEKEEEKEKKIDEEEDEDEDEDGK